MGAKDGTPVNNAFYDDLGDRWLHAQDDPVALLRAEGVAKQAWVKEQLEMLSGPSAAGKGSSGNSLRILDVGCGAGFLARGLRASGHEVHALDMSLPSLRVSRGADASVRYVRGDALALPYPDATFDAVTSMDFLEHIEDPAASVREAARVLKPGGLFFFHTFNRNPLAWLVIIKGVEWFVRNTPEHMHVLRLFIKPRELAGYCRAAGMEPVAWTGVRPDFLRRAFWRMLATRVVPEDFRFVTTRSLLLSYLGVARKTG
jgi:2-polyprenyl-6-hydroxyphenyl methylase / 3-demethylubiquinone-9 3-methyltransferase